MPNKPQYVEELSSFWWLLGEDIICKYTISGEEDRKMIDFDAIQNGSIKEKKSMSSKLVSSIFIFCNLHENQSIHKMVQWNHIINKYVLLNL